MKKIIYLLFALLLLTFSSCRQQTEKFDYGKLNGTLYGNSYFKISVKIPEHWFFVDKDGRAQIIKDNIDRLTKDNPTSNQQMQEAKDFSAQIFTLFKYPPDTLIEVNPSITMTATKIASYPNLKNMDYAIKVGQEGLKEANPDFSFSNTIFDRNFDKIVFNGFNASLTIDGMKANYDMYIANFNEYNLSLTVSYKDEKQKNELYKILQTIKIQ